MGNPSSAGGTPLPDGMQLFLEKNLKGRQIYLPDTLKIQIVEKDGGLEIQVRGDEEGLVELLVQTINGEYKCKSEDVREIAFYKTGVTL